MKRLINPSCHMNIMISLSRSFLYLIPMDDYATSTFLEESRNSLTLNMIITSMEETKSIRDVIL